MSDVPVIEAEDKPYRLVVVATSYSPHPSKPGVTVKNQTALVDEGSFTEQEHVTKNFAVTDAISDAMKALAVAGGFLPAEKPGKPG